MKRRFLSVLIFLFVFITQGVKAISIRGTDVNGDSKKKVGEQFTLHYQIHFSDMEKGLDKTGGVWFVVFELTYDDNVVKLINFSAPNFKTELSSTVGSDQQYIISTVLDNPNSNQYCAHGQLYCGDYSVALKFEVRDTSSTSTSISMTNVKVGLLDMVENREYTEDDVILIEDQRTQTHNLTIVPKKKPVVSNSNTTPSKSSNKFLKSLDIENCEVQFDRQKTDYTVYVDKGINELKVNTTTEDNKATYRVIGADDLSRNNNVVKIEVTAEDTTKKTYYIKVKFKEQEKTVEKGEESSKEKVEPKKLTGKVLKWIGIGFGIFLFIGIVLIVISKIKDHSIDKKLDQLDDD